MKLFFLVFTLPIVALLILFWYLIRFKKAYWLISGYNMMSKEHKNRVDKEKMGDAVSNACLIFAGCLTFGGLFFYWGLNWAGIISLMMIFPVTLVVLIKTNQYDHNNDNPVTKKNNKILIVCFGIFMCIILTVVFSSIAVGIKPNQYTLSGNNLKISGMYGRNIEISSNDFVTMIDELPANLRKTNGYNFGNILKGHFQSGEGKLMLFVDVSKPSFIRLDTTQGVFIFNFQTPDLTQKLYDSLKTAISQSHSS